MNAVPVGTATISRQERKRVPPPASRKRTHPIDPWIKSWIDNVIVPALVDEWLLRGQKGVAA